MGFADQTNYIRYRSRNRRSQEGLLGRAVTAAAVILPSDFELAELNDSKKLTENNVIIFVLK